MTKPKRLIVSPWQLSALADHRLAAVCVPIKQQPGPDIIPARLMAAQPTRRGRYTYMGGEGDPAIEISIRPLCFPGDELFVGEAHAGDFDHEEELWEIVYKSDGECRAYLNEDPPEQMDGGEKFRPSDSYREVYAGRWRSPATMPAWAARHRLLVVSVAAKRARDIAEDEAKACGIRYHGASKTWGSGLTFATATQAFMHEWTARHGKKYPVETSWAWLVRVEVMK